MQLHAFKGRGEQISQSRSGEFPQEPEVMHSFWFQLFEEKKEHKDKCVLVFWGCREFVLYLLFKKIEPLRDVGISTTPLVDQNNRTFHLKTRSPLSQSRPHFSSLFFSNREYYFQGFWGCTCPKKQNTLSKWGFPVGHAKYHVPRVSWDWKSIRL